MENMETMKKGTIPLSIFDLHGYLAPGGTLLLLCYLFEVYARKFYLEAADTLVTPMYFVFNSGVQNVLLAEKTSWVTALVVLVLFTGVAYVAGHVIASLAHGVIDEMLMTRGGSQPYCQLLGIGKSTSRGRRVANFNRGLFFWVNVYLLVRFLELVDISSLRWLPQPPTWIAYWLGWLLLVVFVVLLLAELVWQYLGWRIARMRMFRACMRGLDLLNQAFAWPFNMSIHLGQRFISANECFPEAFRALYKKHFRKRFGVSSEKAGDINFWFCQFYVTDKSSSQGISLGTWSRQFVFTRNLAFGFYLPYIYAILWLAAHRDIEHKANSLMPVLPLLCLVVGFLLLVRFFYIYYNYVHRYTYQAFVYTSIDEDAKLKAAND